MSFKGLGAVITINLSKWYTKVCAQSVLGLGFEIDPLKLCAAPAHTKQLADNCYYYYIPLFPSKRIGCIVNKN